MSRTSSFYDKRPAPPVHTRPREFEEVESYLRPERRARPEFLSKDYGRKEQGPMVLRERETEISSRPLERQPRSISPLRISTRERIMTREPSLDRIHPRGREEERERERERMRNKSQPPPERLLARIVEPRERVPERSMSSQPLRRERRERPDRREREHSVTPPPIERTRTPKVEPTENHERTEILAAEIPPPIHAPPIHQEVITHHRHINHGFEMAKAPMSSVSSNREWLSNEGDMDIYSPRHDNEAITNRREAPVGMTRARTPPRSQGYYDDLYKTDKNNEKERDFRRELSRARSSSAHPERRREVARLDIRESEEEADLYARKTGERGCIGEAKNGATKDWAIIDVPPGTERVRLDGVGGASQEITWQKYSGVRRSKFIPDREQAEEREISPPKRERIRQHIEFRDEPVPKLQVEALHNPTRRRKSDDLYERDYERMDESGDWRDRGMRPPRQSGSDLWTEITKDLVAREAIVEMGYEFEETEFFYYILQYLQYEDVLDLVKLSEQIRYERQQRLREIEWERKQLEYRERELDELEWKGREREREEWERREREQEEWERRRRSGDRDYDDERILEREIIFERGPRRKW